MTTDASGMADLVREIQATQDRPQPNTLAMSTDTYAGLRVLAGRRNGRRRSRQVRGTRARNYTRARARERSSL